MQSNTVIHYSSTMRIPSTFKSQGQGECGKAGTISGWPGVVTCKACLKMLKAENIQTFTKVKM